MSMEFERACAERGHTGQPSRRHHHHGPPDGPRHRAGHHPSAMDGVHHTSDVVIGGLLGVTMGGRF
jgi:hypothetical protein